MLWFQKWLIARASSFPTFWWFVTVSLVAILDFHLGSMHLVTVLFTRNPDFGISEVLWRNCFKASRTRLFFNYFSPIFSWHMISQTRACSWHFSSLLFGQLFQSLMFDFSLFLTSQNCTFSLEFFTTVLPISSTLRMCWVH